jgi:hypothetical protein
MYNGSKLFWRTQENINIDIYLHLAENCVEVIGYDGHTNHTYPRLFFSLEKLLSLIGHSVVDTHFEQAKLKCIDEFNNLNIPLPPDRDIRDEEIRLLVSSHILSKLQMHEKQFQYYFPEDALTENPLLSKAPDSVIPVLVNRRRLSTTQEINQAINALELSHNDIEEKRKQAEELALKVENLLDANSDIVNKSEEQSTA